MAETKLEELRFGRVSCGIGTDTISGTQRRLLWVNNLFDPLTLITGQGAWYDPSDLSSMFQDSAGTTAAIVGQPVGKLNDKSGNGNHLLQATAGFRPILRQLGLLYYLDFDGVDDIMTTAGNVDLSAFTAISIFLGATINTATTGIILSNNAGAGGTTGGFRATFNSGLAATSPMGGTFWDATTASQLYETTAAAPPRTVVQTLLFDYAGVLVTDEIKIRRNGIDQALSVASPGPVTTVNFASGAIAVGGPVGGGGNFLAGRFFGGLLRGTIATAAQIAGMEAYLGLRTGVAI